MGTPNKLAPVAAFTLHGRGGPSLFIVAPLAHLVHNLTRNGGPFPVMTTATAVDAGPLMMTLYTLSLGTDLVITMRKGNVTMPGLNGYDRWHTRNSGCRQDERQQQTQP